MRTLKFGLTASAAELKQVAELIQAECDRLHLDRDSHAGYCALILGSTWPSRFWPAVHYAELIRTLQDKYGMRSVMLGSKSEEPSAAEIESLLGQQPVLNLVSKTSLRELPAVFDTCRFAVGSDSGPMHIAAASGSAVVSLWGSTSHERSAPYGSEDLVLDAAIGCSPCFRKNCPGLGTLCMKEIPPAAVLAQIDRIINREKLQNTERTG